MTPDEIDALPGAEAPDVTHRLVPSRFPPVQAFEAAGDAEDLAAVMELEGWTNDRLSEVRLKRLPAEDWVFGRPNASIVMAAFLHGAPEGSRFAGPDLGAWYGASRMETALLEVLNGVRREIARSALSEKVEVYREYRAALGGRFADIRGGHVALHDPDPACYPKTQVFGEAVRASEWAGIAYDAVRDPEGENWVSYRARLVEDVVQARHFRATVRDSGKVVVEDVTG